MARFLWRLDSTPRSLLSLALLTPTVWALGAAPGLAQPRVTATPAAAIKKKAAGPPPGPVLAVVSIAKQRVRIYGSTGLLAHAPVSTGMAGHRTPTGVFSILQKSRFHRSNIYSNAPMPYMQRITWSGVALHAGVLPGYAASHGCIRLPHAFAVQLWGMTKVGTRVVVAPDEATAVSFEHARLPVPRMTPAPADEDRQPEKGTEVASAAGAAISDAAGDPPRPRLLDPYQRARALKALAAADAVAKARATKVAADTAAAKADEARKGAAALRAAELALAAVRRRREAAAKAVGDAATPAGERASQTLAIAEADLAEAQWVADDARLIEAVRADEAASAASAAVAAENAHREATAALKAAERAGEPISIFVSRKAGRVYIRQAWAPIHEAPVSFTAAGPPLGTHLYVAMGPAADGETMGWLSVSLPPSAAEPQRRRSNAGQPAQAASVPGLGQETAASALARFELPEGTRRFIEDRLWTGASLLVSDYGISNETGTYTDFIVLTR